jgi:hypothetical protein
MIDGTYIKTGRHEFDALVPIVRSFLEKDLLELAIDGKTVRGFRSPDVKSIWIRDHSDMLRIGRYFFEDVTSAVEHFGETQADGGRIFDYFTTFPEKPPCERENWTKYVRVPVEADVEYRFVKAAYLAWQACGDDEWIRRLLPKMEKALGYVISHPWYWDAKRGLVKRPYTVDTWDFAYTAGTHERLQFQIDANTFWGIMHGDNSGYFEAFRIVARLYDRFGDRRRAEFWRDEAERLKAAMNTLCWNGDFYTHFAKMSDVTIPGVDESSQLSLSNPMDINRGVANQAQAEAIIGEYVRRRERTGAFAEWFSIDPPFPAGVFGDEKLKEGAYVNGGIMPLVGGELAKAAFRHGFETYGVDILRRYSEMVTEKGESYLWYFPDGTPSSVETSTSPEAQPTDGWGSSAMLEALVGGLAGVEDLGSGFDQARILPRWVAAGIDEAEVQLTYPASGRAIKYTYRRAESAISLVIRATGSDVECRALLPDGRDARSVVAGGRDIDWRSAPVRNSTYVQYNIHVDGQIRIDVHLR